MADGKETNVTIAAAKEAARELLSTFFNELKKGKEVRPEEEPRLFFPNGIELIYFSVAVSGITVTFKVAGAKGISGLLESVEIGGGFASEASQEITE